MCIIAVQPVGTSIPDEYLDQMWKNNPDMAGYSFVKDGALVTKKFTTLAEFKGAYLNDWWEYGADSTFLLHFRIKTHGAITLENCHPFQVHPELVFAHNGIISIKIPDKFKEYSDTWYFNRSVLRQLPRNFLRNQAVMELIREYIGHSKLAFLDASGNYHIVNEQLGQWEKGVWYSNSTFRPWQMYSYGSSAYTSYWKESKKEPAAAVKFDDTLDYFEASCAGYDSIRDNRYYQQKLTQFQAGVKQILLEPMDFQRVLAYATEHDLLFKDVYLDDDKLAAALGLSLEDLLLYKTIPMEPEELDAELEEESFYTSLTPEQKERIEAFADSMGLEYDDVYLDRGLVEQITGTDFVEAMYGGSHIEAQTA